MIHLFLSANIDNRIEILRQTHVSFTKDSSVTLD